MKKNPGPVREQARQENFKGKSGQALILRAAAGIPETIVCGIEEQPSYEDGAKIAAMLLKSFGQEALKHTSFEIKGGHGLKAEALERLCAGWSWACYHFSAYKSDPKPEKPALLWLEGVDRARVKALIESTALIRNLVNLPANDLGPEELERAARDFARKHGAKIKVTADKDLLEKNFPVIYAVGDSSARRPRLIDITRGDPKHPKVTLVGKGVCFDTGGLDIKPSQYMRLMKKDMGGAAHALGLAHMVIALNLPVRLRVLIPAVENAVSGTAFRPGDIFTSRKGLTIENTNTDAEGRLILSDALTYACEDKPDLLIDFATLTGSARAALGQDIPAVFSSDDRLAEELKKLALAADDPVWPMPLWQPYKRHIESPAADLVNSASLPGDLIYSALFLQRFVDEKTPWIHLDVFAWESSGRPGRPQGGADTGMRAVFSLLEKRYGTERR